MSMKAPTPAPAAQVAQSEPILTWRERRTNWLKCNSQKREGPPSNDPFTTAEIADLRAALASRAPAANADDLELVHQLRSKTGHGGWQWTDADGETSLKRMPHWADLYEFRTLAVLPGTAHGASGHFLAAGTPAIPPAPVEPVSALTDEQIIEIADRSEMMARDDALERNRVGKICIKFARALFAASHTTKEST